MWVSNRSWKSTLVPFLGTAVALLAAIAVVLAPATDASARAPEMHLGGFDGARIGDSLAEVRQKVARIGPCYRLGGSCACASTELGDGSLTFVFGLDRASDLDFLFTSAAEIVGPRGIRVGDSPRKFKRLFPHAHHLRQMYPHYSRLAFEKRDVALLAEVYHGKIVMLATGPARYLNYEEYCG